MRDAVSEVAGEDASAEPLLFQKVLRDRDANAPRDNWPQLVKTFRLLIGAEARSAGLLRRQGRAAAAALEFLPKRRLFIL